MDPRHFWLYHKLEPKKGRWGGHCSRFCRWRFLALSGVVWRCEWDKPSAAVALLATGVELPSLPSWVARTLVEMAEKGIGRTKDKRERRTEHNFACGNYDRERIRKFLRWGMSLISSSRRRRRRAEGQHPPTNKQKHPTLCGCRDPSAGKESQLLHHNPNEEQPMKKGAVVFRFSSRRLNRMEGSPQLSGTGLPGTGFLPVVENQWFG